MSKLKYKKLIHDLPPKGRVLPKIQLATNATCKINI